MKEISMRRGFLAFSIFGALLVPANTFGEHRVRPPVEPKIEVGGSVKMDLPLEPVILNGLVLPLHLVFESGKSMTRSCLGLGEGWRVPLLDSSLVQDGENSYLWQTPTGDSIRFQRRRPDAEMANGKYKLIFEAGDPFIKTEAGTTYRFNKGRLSQIAGFDGNVVTISRGVDSVYLKENGILKLQVQRNEVKGRPSIIIQNGDLIYNCILGQRPMVEIDGNRRLIGKLANSLSEVSSAGRNLCTIRYSVNDGVFPVFQFLTPNFASEEIVDSGASLSNESSDVPFFKIDELGATLDQRTELGVRIVTSMFVSGVLDGKVRKRSVCFADGTEYVLRYIYDENGELIRVVDESVRIK